MTGSRGEGHGDAGKRQPASSRGFAECRSAYGVDSSRRTQSPKPEALLAAGCMLRVPKAGKGEPETVVGAPLEGSIHRAVTCGPASLEKSMVMERKVGV